MWKPFSPSSSNNSIQFSFCKKQNNKEQTKPERESWSMVERKWETHNLAMDCVSGFWILYGLYTVSAKYNNFLLIILLHFPLDCVTKLIFMCTHTKNDRKFDNYPNVLYTHMTHTGNYFDDTVLNPMILFCLGF